MSRIGMIQSCSFPVAEELSHWKSLYKFWRSTNTLHFQQWWLYPVLVPLIQDVCDECCTTCLPLSGPSCDHQIFLEAKKLISWEFFVSFSFFLYHRRLSIVLSSPMSICITNHPPMFLVFFCDIIGLDKFKFSFSWLIPCILYVHKHEFLF